MHMDSTRGPASAFTDQGESSRGNGDSACAQHALTGQMAALQAENRDLRAQLECVRAEKARATDILNRLAEVLGTNAPERLVHDVRNVLNERELYRALADVSE